MHIGFIVGIIVAITAIGIGIVGLISSKKNNSKIKWALWVILFGVLALISAAINSGILLKLF
jgi:hypothetical protein